VRDFRRADADSIEPSAPCVAVWLSPHTMMRPEYVIPAPGRRHMHDALARVVEAHQHHAMLAVC
jgi:hypothetical protein